MTKDEIDAIERRATNLKRMMDIEVQVVLDLCAAARSADAAVADALRKALDLGDPSAHASYATIDGLGMLIKTAREGATKMYDDLHGQNGAKKRAEDAEAAARTAWRLVETLRAALVVAAGLIHEVEGLPHGGDRTANKAWFDGVDRLDKLVELYRG